MIIINDAMMHVLESLGLSLKSDVLYINSSVILMPGQTLPQVIYNPLVATQLERLIDSGIKTFASIYAR